MVQQKKSLQLRFIQFIRENLKDNQVFETPMALFEWFLAEWDRPMNVKNQQQAYMAVWAVALDDGLVKL